MFPRRLLPLLLAALIIALAIAVPAQAPPAAKSDSASDPNVLTNQFIIEAAAKLPEEIIITKSKPRRRTSTCQLPRWLN